MGQIETAGAEARGVPPAPALQRRHQARRGRRPVLGALPRGRRRARRPVHLPPGRRALPDGHQRRQPRQGPGLVSRARRRFRRRGERRPRRLGDARRAGPGRARGARARSPSGELPARMRTAELAAGRRRGARLRHRLHRRGRLRADARARRRRRRLGRAAGRGACGRPGLGARDTLRLEVCFHLYGNDLSEDRNPIEAGLGWCCKLDTGFVGAEALRRRRARPDARARSPSPAPASRARTTR